MSNNILFKDLSYTIIGIAFKIHSKLGCALPEICYHNAFELELTTLNIPFTTQETHNVFYNDASVGHFHSDIIVDNKIILRV